MPDDTSDLIRRLLAAAQVLDDECISLENTATARDLLREAASVLGEKKDPVGPFPPGQ